MAGVLVYIDILQKGYAFNTIYVLLSLYTVTCHHITYCAQDARSYSPCNDLCVIISLKKATVMELQSCFLPTQVESLRRNQRPTMSAKVSGRTGKYDKATTRKFH